MDYYDLWYVELILLTFQVKNYHFIFGVNLLVVITVSRHDLDDHKNKNGVATDIFCTGVISHPVDMFLNQGPKTLIQNKWTGPQNKTWNSKFGSSITCEEGLAPSRRLFKNGTK